ncbi:hypothetical protein [Inhella gelatinilytica]|uniref:Uncharacterized protein n=1 Tax=Inhella gelatinilytica TaxID=2795030 RepID=A0A931IUZ0_9BURK|nr:hypothetical protein [Inhella gelatinilytica]MBH9551474.1 hypothetical protein [Inhella gelatinilytica]
MSNRLPFSFKPWALSTIDSEGSVFDATATSLSLGAFGDRVVPAVDALNLALLPIGLTDLWASVAPVEVLEGDGLLELVGVAEAQGAHPYQGAPVAIELRVESPDTWVLAPGVTPATYAWLGDNFDLVRLARVHETKAGLLEFSPDIDDWVQSAGWSILIGSGLLPDPFSTVDWVGVDPSAPTGL